MYAWGRKPRRTSIFENPPTTGKRIALWERVGSNLSHSPEEVAACIQVVNVDDIMTQVGFGGFFVTAIVFVVTTVA